MKSFVNPLLSISAPLLILVAIFGLLQRTGSQRLQCLPPLVVGTGLIISGAVRRYAHRKKLLLALKDSNDFANNHPVLKQD